MKRIAHTSELTSELNRLVISAEQPKPSRIALATELRELAFRLEAGTPKQAASESAQIAAQITDIMAEIEKLRKQAAKAEATGQLDRADNLRSKTRDLKHKLELTQSDYASALHRETE